MSSCGARGFVTVGVEFGPHGCEGGNSSTVTIDADLAQAVAMEISAWVSEPSVRGELVGRLAVAMFGSDAFRVS